MTRLCETCRVRRVKRVKNRFCSPACVPRSLRAANCRKGRKTYAYRRRALAFRADLERLGPRTTREELLDVFQGIYKRAYNTGWEAGRAGSSLADARDRGAA